MCLFLCLNLFSKNIYFATIYIPEDGKEISVSSNVKESLDRRTGRYTTILNLEGHKNDISKIRKIKQISILSKGDMKLLYDQQIKIDLVK
ncbi:MAG: hypothetical protein ACRC03_03075 [Romboutsia sp.]